MAGAVWRAVRPAVYRLDAERAHYLTMGLLRTACAVPGGAALLRWAFRVRGGRGVLGEPVEVAGIRFPNRVGLAAGFDKDCLLYTSPSPRDS